MVDESGSVIKVITSVLQGHAIRGCAKRVDRAVLLLDQLVAEKLHLMDLQRFKLLCVIKRPEPWYVHAEFRASIKLLNWD